MFAVFVVDVALTKLPCSEIGMFGERFRQVLCPHTSENRITQESPNFCSDHIQLTTGISPTLYLSTLSPTGLFLIFKQSSRCPLPTAHPPPRSSARASGLFHITRRRLPSFTRPTTTSSQRRCVEVKSRGDAIAETESCACGKLN